MDIFIDGARINFTGTSGNKINVPSSVIMERILVLSVQGDNPVILNHTYGSARQLTVGTNITVIGSDREQSKISGIYLGESEGRIKLLVLPDNSNGEGVVNLLPADKFSYRGVPAYIIPGGRDGQQVQISMITTDITWKPRYQVSVNDRNGSSAIEGVILSAHITNDLPTHFNNFLKSGRISLCVGSHQNTPIRSYKSDYVITEKGTHQVPLQLVKSQSLGTILLVTIDLEQHNIQTSLGEIIQIESGNQPGYMDILMKGESGYKTITTWINEQAVIPLKEIFCATTMIFSGATSSFDLDLSKQNSLSNTIAVKIINNRGLVPSGISFVKSEDGTTTSYHIVGTEKRIRINLI